MYVHEYPIRIRYYHTDQMGVVYHGNYASFYEIARVEGLRDLGLLYKDFEEQGILMPILEIKSKFLKPARYDELITVRSRIKELPGTRIYFDYEILNEAGQVIHIAETTLVFVSKATMRPCPPPESLMRALEPFFRLA